MRKVMIAAMACGLLATPVMAQVNQGQGGAPSAKSGGTMDNPRTNKDKGANAGSGTVTPQSTTGAAPVKDKSAIGNTGKSGGEGGSGR